MTGRNIRASHWHDFIAGYFVGVDFVNKGLLQHALENGSSWCLPKGGDGFAAVSDFIPREQVKDHREL